MKDKDKAMLASYARSVVGALIAVYSTGTTDPSDYGKGAIAAIAPLPKSRGSVVPVEYTAMRAPTTDRR
jgi:hypothetical protein